MLLKKSEVNEENYTVFEVEADAAEFDAALNKAYGKNRGQINIPGFRKGKAPRRIIEGMYGQDVFYQDALDEIAPQAFEFGVSEGKLKFIGRPSIENVSVNEDKTASFSFKVQNYPIVTLGEYKGLKAPKPAVEISEEAVTEEVDKIRKRNARKVDVDREAQMGDTVNIDFEGTQDGVPFDGGKADSYELELGSNSFVPGFEEQIVGMKPGEEKDIDITFPENYYENLAGKAVVFHIKLNSVTYLELPEADDEFAKDVGFDTLEEYRKSLRDDLEKKAGDDAEQKFRGEILRQACENMKVDIPDVMIEEQVEKMIRDYGANMGLDVYSMNKEKLYSMLGITDDIIEGSLKQGAEIQVKTDLLIDAVAKAENISFTEEEAEEYIKKVAEDSKATVEDIKKYFGEEYIMEQHIKEAATEILMDSAVVDDAPAQEAPAEEKAPEAVEAAPKKKPGRKKKTEKTDGE